MDHALEKLEPLGPVFSFVRREKEREREAGCWVFSLSYSFSFFSASLPTCFWRAHKS